MADGKSVGSSFSSSGACADAFYRLLSCSGLRFGCAAVDFGCVQPAYVYVLGALTYFGALPLILPSNSTRTDDCGLRDEEAEEADKLFGSYRYTRARCAAAVSSCSTLPLIV